MNNSNSDFDFSFINSVEDFLLNDAPTERGLVISHTLKETLSSPEQKQRKSERGKKLAQNLVWRKNQAVGAKKRKEKYWNNPDWRSRQQRMLDNKGKKRRVYVMTPDGIMHGFMSACDYYNISKGSFRDRMHYNPTEYFYCDSDGNPVEGRKITNTKGYKESAKARWRAIMTPEGEFPSLRHACKHFNLTGATIREKLKSQKPIHNEWYYLED